MREIAEAPTRSVAALPAPVWCEAVQFTDDVVYQVDRELQQVFLNEAGHVCLDLDTDAGAGKSILPFFHEEDRVRMQAELARVFRTGHEATDLDVRVVGVRGRVTPLSHRLRAIRDPAGTTVGVLGIGRDVSAVRRLEDQLQHSQKLETIGLLAGGIAHDFNNMLAAILGYTELMLEEKSADDPDRRPLDYIHTSTERAAALVKQLLIFSRKSAARLVPLRLGSVVEETLRILDRTVPKTIRIASHYPKGETDEDRVLGDAVRLQQAIMNICLNARDAMPNGGELRIEVERITIDTVPDPARNELRPGDHVRLRIQDTGRGMAPELLERIWDPFFTTKGEGEGTGLGLSVVNGLVRAHRGYVQVESQVGRGTTFYIYLPAATGADLDAPQQIAEPPGGTETILTVDDEPVLLGLLHDILRPKGYHVLSAEAWDQAIDYVETVGDQIDLVITDNMMPGMTGRELAREIRSRQPEMRILVCSGFSPTRESEVGEMDYVSSYVQKPYQRRDLLARVREALDGALARD